MKRYRDFDISEERENKRCKVDISEKLSDLCELIKLLEIIDTKMADNMKCCNYCEVDLPMEDMIRHVEEKTRLIILKKGLIVHRSMLKRKLMKNLQ